MPAAWDVAVVGGGQAGSQVATELRQRGFSGSIAVIDRQRHMPYARPPLTKDFLSGHVSSDSLFFRTDEYWERQEVKFLLGVDVEELTPGERTVRLSDGRVLG
jgi:3-phenylpropionate/trans-cinnamate dioxygenase ferredoxin reductase subunit